MSTYLVIGVLALLWILVRHINASKAAKQFLAEMKSREQTPATDEQKTFLADCDRAYGKLISATSILATSILATRGARTHNAALCRERDQAMTKECVTHHYACDCREAAHKAEFDITRIRAALEQAFIAGYNAAVRETATSQICTLCGSAR